MTVKPLYKYGNAVTPRRRNPDDPIHGYRLVADDGKILTNGVEFAEIIDVLVSEVNDWQEIDMEG